MNKTLLSLSALLNYPDADFMAALGEIREHLQAETIAGRICPQNLAGLNSLIDYLMGSDLFDLQETYVACFDLGRFCSLHLFEHIHGESRDRGQAMVDLRQRYEKGGLELAKNELPDYLPLLLEYLATRDQAEQQELLGDFAPIIRLIGQRLCGDQAPWAAVFPAIWEAAGLPAPADAEPQISASDNNPGGKNAAPAGGLDEDWQEAPAWGPDPRLVRRIAGSGLNGGAGPLQAPEGLPKHHPLHSR